eukprot:s1348_g15.t1
MKTEVQQLERLKVGRCLVEKSGREMAKQKKVSVLTRWALTQKTAEIARCRYAITGEITTRRTMRAHRILRCVMGCVMSGGVLMFRGCCVKVFSRKQEVPALSSAEAELYSLVENSKELIAVALLLETILAGIELDALGTPLRFTGSYSLILRNDAQAQSQ